MSEDILLMEKSEAGYAVLTLNRPRALNALSIALCKRLCNAVRELQDDPAIRVLILTGAGRAFCAGLDVKEMRADPDAFFTAMRAHSPAQALESFSGPVIGAINGDAITGGFEIALICDLLIASDSARFADTHTRIGLIPGWGLSQRLSRLVGVPRAKEISLTARFVTAAHAGELGLVNSVVLPDELLPRARGLACDMLAGVPRVLSAYHQLIDDGYELPLAEGLKLERRRALESTQRPMPARAR